MKHEFVDNSIPDQAPARVDYPDRWSLDHLLNVGHCLTETARRMPESLAVACPVGTTVRARIWYFGCKSLKLAGQRSPNSASTEYRQISFQALEQTSNRIAQGLQNMGLPVGTRMALLVPPGIDFVAWVFGLFKAGLVTILIDPGMGRKNIVRCLSAAEPEGMVGIPLAHFARTLFRRKLPHCRHNVVLGYWPGCHRAAEFETLSEIEFEPVAIDRKSPAAIIFTTGSTGPPKGVLYRHRNFIEQAQQIRDYFQIRPGTVDVSGFPLFALFNTAMGGTTIFPKMDATRPAKVDPPEIIHAVNLFQADQSFGSPALWNTVTRYCLANQVKLPSIKRVLSAGAPVAAELLDRIKKIIDPAGEVYTPYGATEALPVACNSASIVLSETAAKTCTGGGTCVGRKFPDIEWKVIRIVDHPLHKLSDCEEMPLGEIGELMVSGPVVTDQYVTSPEANRLHKILDGNAVWHRMGDVGYLDDQQRFWFCGRKSHRVQTPDGTLYTIPCEAIINNHPHIYRSALVGVGEPGNEIPVIIAEPLSEHWPRADRQQNALRDQLIELARQHPLTQSIKHILLHRSLPVDIRHNSKIFREKLRPWAAQRIQ